MQPNDRRAEWAEQTARHLKGELKKRDVTYDDLAERLKKLGYKKETKASIANKLSRGDVPGTLLLACPVAIGSDTIRLEDV